VQQLLTESAVLGLLGGLSGLTLAYWGKGLLLAYLAPDLPSLDAIAVDHRVLFFNVAVALLTGVLFGLAPAFQASKMDLTRSLKESGRGTSEGLPRRRLQNALVVVEVAIAVVLLCGSGLLVRSFLRLRATDGGYKSDRILTMTFDLSGPKYREPGRQAAFFEQLLERIARMQGVLSAGASSTPPFSMYRGTLNEIAVEGRSMQATTVDLASVTPGYFHTLGIPLLAGRDLAWSDREGAPGVVLVNESFARQFFPGGDCLGKRVRNWDNEKQWLTIVGVVRDVRTDLETDAVPGIYTAHLQSGMGHMTVVVQTAGEPMALVDLVRSQAALVDKTQPPHDVETLERAISEHFTSRRVTMTLVAVFAVLALVLGAIGIYGVLSYTVRRQTHEIGIRLALGADKDRILIMVLGRGLLPVGAGALIGTAASLGLTRVIASELWGVTARDPWTFAVVVSVIIVTGLAACVLPAWRAASVDAMVSLRYE
jgi:putative ABC transport system permease protein